MAGRSLLTLRYPTRGARKVLDTLAQRLPRYWGAALDQVAEIYKQELENATPIGRGPTGGAMARSWHVRRVAAASRSRRIIYNTKKYLKIVLRGRRAIDQLSKPPEQRKKLRFVIDNQVLFRWRVRAARANPFHRRAYNKGRRRMLTELPALSRRVLVQSRGGRL
jgi:hypothetical protein